MTRSGDSGDDHREVKKNGRDHLQDSEIRRLREALVSLESQHEQNENAHSAILAKLQTYEVELRIANVRAEERGRAETSLRRQVLALALLFLSTASGVVAWAVTEFRDVHDAISNNSAHFREFQAIGIEWGDNLDLRDKEIKEDLRQLRRLVNEHQRNKREHSK